MSSEKFLTLQKKNSMYYVVRHIPKNEAKGMSALGRVPILLLLHFVYCNEEEFLQAVSKSALMCNYKFIGHLSWQQSQLPQLTKNFLQNNKN